VSVVQGSATAAAFVPMCETTRTTAVPAVGSAQAGSRVLVAYVRAGAEVVVALALATKSIVHLKRIRTLDTAVPKTPRAVTPTMVFGLRVVRWVILCLVEALIAITAFARQLETEQENPGFDFREL
jgi:hypothetical protein